jgi:KaiC/GvpD/RAD55 family RecA-like ATPase
MNEVTQETQQTIVKLSQIVDDQIKREPSLITGLLRRGQMLAISAPKVSLKTSLAIHLAVSIGYGLNWLGWQCNQSKVLYVNLNITKNECIVRFSEALNHLNLDRSAIDSIDILNIEITKSVSNLVNDIIQAIGNQKYRVVIIDSLDNLPKNAPWQYEDKTQELKRLLQSINGCLVFTESHNHKPVGNEEARAMAEWSDVLTYSDILLEFVPMKLDYEKLRIERLQAVWELSKKILNTHNKNYYLMNVTDKYIDKDTSTSELLRQHLETALNALPEETLQGVLYDFDALDIPIKNRTYWHLETISNSLPPEEASNNLFYYPILKNDVDKILEFHEPGIDYQGEKEKSEIELEEEREYYTEKLQNGIDEFFKKNNRFPIQKELADTLQVKRQTISTWQKKTGGNIVIIDGSYQSL